VFGGSPDSGGQFRVGTFGRNLASVAVKLLSHLKFKDTSKILYFQCDLQR
jgi:hypothetical protein